MKISEMLAMLTKLKTHHGDIECESDCPFCGRSFHVGEVAIAPETIRLGIDPAPENGPGPDVLRSAIRKRRG